MTRKSSLLTLAGASAAIALVGAAAVFFLPISAPFASNSEPSEVVGRLGKAEITEADLSRRFDGLAADQVKLMSENPKLLEQVIVSALVQEALVHEAEEKKWQERPEVAAALEQARAELIAESWLNAQVKLPEGFPEESLIQEIYDNNKESFRTPRRFRLAQIYIALPANADESDVKAAEQKLSSLQKKLASKGADFAALAREYSDADEVAEKGGEIGWLTEAQMRPEIRAEVAGLAEGVPSEALRLDDGWHILKLLDTQPPGFRPLAEVKPQLIATLRREKFAAEKRLYVERLLKETPPAIDNISVSKILEESQK